MSAPVTEKTATDPPALRWLKPDAYHIRTECDRYTVCRMAGPLGSTYIAWRLPQTELASRVVADSGTDEQRKSAIKAMQLACYEDSRTVKP